MNPGRCACVCVSVCTRVDIKYSPLSNLGEKKEISVTADNKLQFEISIS